MYYFVWIVHVLENTSLLQSFAQMFCYIIQCNFLYYMQM